MPKCIMQDMCNLYSPIYFIIQQRKGLHKRYLFSFVHNDKVCFVFDFILKFIQKFLCLKKENIGLK